VKILVTGGAGYVGSVLIGDMLNLGYSVVCYDRLDHGISPIAGYLEHPNFALIVDDIRRGYALQQALLKADAVIHLAALVGYPICEQSPKEAEGINLFGSIMLNESRSKHQRVIYASTESVYGGVKNADNGILHEWMQTDPHSVYARTKLDSESPFLDKGNAVVFRFATGYGLSPRMRADTMVNDFTRQIVRSGTLSLYEPNVLRSFVHVRQMARVLLHGLGAFEGLYNVSEIGLRKEALVKKIIDQVGYGHVTYGEGADLEMRDYFMDCSRLRESGFEFQPIHMESAIKAMARYFTHDTAC